jgi:hypothetical protein
MNQLFPLSVAVPLLVAAGLLAFTPSSNPGTDSATSS